jgi:WS/DGAT/MGAT family acyltransferase
MPNPDRLTGLDASFLALEDAGAHMHVGSCLLFEGKAPGYVEFVEQLDSRMHLVPRYRQKLAFPPLTQARPVWIDDPHFNPGYHVRHTALPEPASLEQLRNLAGRVLAQRLDRGKPLWEIWLSTTSRAAASRWSRRRTTAWSTASRASTSRPCCSTPRPTPIRRPSLPRRGSRARAERRHADGRRAGRAGEHARSTRCGSRSDALSHPEKSAERLGRAAYGFGAMLRAGLQGAPPSPYNVEIGPHRRFAWADGELAQFKAIKTRLGGTVNDVVLTVVTGALRTHMQANDHDVDGVELKAMVPVSVRAEAERGALGNRVTSMFAPLPIYADDPVERFEIVHEAMKGLKESGQAVGAELLTELGGLRAARPCSPRRRACSPPSARSTSW